MNKQQRQEQYNKMVEIYDFISEEIKSHAGKTGFNELLELRSKFHSKFVLTSIESFTVFKYD